MARVAMLLMKNLVRALRLRRIDAADSEPHWLRPEQYHEQDGWITLVPDQVSDLYVYATRNRMRPLGLVIVESDGEYRQLVNERPTKPEHREFARELFCAHVDFWFRYLPSLERQKQT